jgi:hypothetical protein
MSYTTVSNIATCNLNVNSAEEAITLCVDWLQNHPEDMPSYLEEFTMEEVRQELSLYITMENGEQDGEVKVSMDTEDENGIVDIWDFIVGYFKEVHVGEYMVISYNSYCSKNGHSSSMEYYGEGGKFIDIDTILGDLPDVFKDVKAMDAIRDLLSNLDGGRSYKVLDQIVDIVKRTGREVAV